jgi:hypothetical protein
MRAFTAITALSTSVLLQFAPGFTTAEEAAAVQVPVSKLVSKDLLSGTDYTLQPKASIVSSRAVYTLKSPAGTDEVTGTVSLLERANEIRAVETLEAMKKTDVYGDALKNSAKGPVKFGKGLVTEPVDTVSNTAKGLGSFLADVGYSVVSDDPSQDNVAKTGLGFATAKRKFAFKLGVNPYSQYQPLQDALSEVSWTAVGGGLTVTVAFSAVANTAGSVLSGTSFANTARQAVRDNSPRKLQNMNFDSLQAMGVSEDLAEAQLNNLKYDPEAETRLVTALASMKKVAGRDDVVARATLASSYSAANEMRDWVELLAAYHAKVERASKLVVIGSAPFLVDKKKRVHGVFPTDYIVWSPSFAAQIADITKRIADAGYTTGTISVTGMIDPKVVELLRSSGWTSVQANAETILRAK